MHLKKEFTKLKEINDKANQLSELAEEYKTLIEKSSSFQLELEIQSEISQLNNEKTALTKTLSSITDDINTLTAITDEFNQSKTNIKNEKSDIESLYQDLKDEIDVWRDNYGLHKLPTLKDLISRGKKNVLEDQGMDDHGKCFHCSITETSQWRVGPTGPRSLCNKCGIAWGKKNLRWGTKNLSSSSRKKQKS